MFPNLLVTIDLLNNAMNLRENTGYVESSYFQCLQLIDSLPERWKFTIKENYGNDVILSFMTFS